MRQGQHRIDGVGRRVARPAEHRHSGIRHAARRAQHPPRDRHARPGRAAARVQARRGGRLHPRQRHQPHRLFGRADPKDRHHDGRQELSGRAPGARRPRHRRGARQPARRAPVQGRLPVAARHRAPQGFRARTGDDHRRRGKALAHRGAGARGPLRNVNAAAGRSARRTSAATGCSRPRARSIPTISPSPSASG